MGKNRTIKIVPRTKAELVRLRRRELKKMRAAFKAMQEQEVTFGRTDKAMRTGVIEEGGLRKEASPPSGPVALK